MDIKYIISRANREEYYKILIYIREHFNFARHKNWRKQLQRDGALPLGSPFPKITTLSLGGAVAPGCDNVGRKYPAKKLDET